MDESYLVGIGIAFLCYIIFFRKKEKPLPPRENPPVKPNNTKTDIEEDKSRYTLQKEGYIHNAQDFDEIVKKTPIRNSISQMKEPQELYPLTEEMDLVYNSIIKSDYQLFFLSGQAGTGKSNFIKTFINRHEHESVCLAPTGIAAINIKGQTIHSFFKFPLKIINKNDIKKLKQPKVFQAINYMIIDECSMLRSDLLDAVDYSLQVNRNSEEPFGGVKIILVGDLYQLPPVVKPRERAILKKMEYITQYFFSSNVFKNTLNKKKIFMHEFKTVFRQKDSEYLDILNNIRKYNLDMNVSKVLDKHLIEDIEEAPKTSIILTTTNDRASSYNDTQLNMLKTEEKVYIARITGEFIGKEKEYPNESELRLKVGAKVLFTKNDSGKRWINGSLGIVEKLFDDRILVSHDGLTHEVKRVTTEKIKYKYVDGIIETEVVGTFEQFPLKLAWAITIHKSQGMTLDNIVVDTMTKAFAPGQVYVALSRCRSIDNLYLMGSITGGDILVDQDVQRFYEYIEKNDSINRVDNTGESGEFPI